MQGIAVDLVNAIAEDAGFSVTYVEPIAFGDLIPALMDGRIDISAANNPITPANQDRIGLSDAYARTGEGLVIMESDPTEYRSLEDLRGKAVGHVRGSPYAALVEQMPGVFSEVRTYETTPDALRGVTTGEITAAILPASIASFIFSQGEFPNLRLAEAYEMAMPVRLGIGVRKEETDLLNRINASLAKLTADGTAQAIFSKYGVTWVEP
jgi:polar amino acid transport system substrate-binding protein